MEILLALVNVARRFVFMAMPKSIQRNVDRDSVLGDALVLITMLFIAFVAWFLVSSISEWFSIDKCLDMGGAWNYEKDACIE